MHLLEGVREFLPISGQEWDLVANRHSAYHPELDRTADHLKKKFNELARRTIPTGDPNCPADVREAKAIRHLIIEKSDGCTGSPNEGFGFSLDNSDPNGSDDNDNTTEPPEENDGDEQSRNARTPDETRPQGFSNRLQDMLDGVSASENTNEEYESGSNGNRESRRESNGNRSNSSHSNIRNAPTPLQRRLRRRVDDSGEPSFTQIMMMMVNQQNRETRE